MSFWFKWALSTGFVCSSVQESSSSNAAAELIEAQAALKALESRFAEVVAENVQVVAGNKILRMETKLQALQTQNQQLQAQLTPHEQELSRSRDDSTFEVDDLKRELVFSRWIQTYLERICNIIECNVMIITSALCLFVCCSDWESRLEWAWRASVHPV